MNIGELLHPMINIFNVFLDLAPRLEVNLTSAPRATKRSQFPWPADGAIGLHSINN